MTDIKLAFAKDIHYTPVRKTRDVTPVMAEERILEKCKELDAVFHGFVLPYTTYSKVKISITFNKNGRNKVCGLRGFIDGCVSGKTVHDPATKREQEARELCKKHGKIFKGFEFIDRNNSYIHAHCPIHNEDFTRTHKTVKYSGSFMCDTCVELLNSSRTGITSLKKVMTVNNTYHFYLLSLDDKFIKFGVAASLRKRFGEIQRSSKFKHSVIYTHEFKKAWQAIDLEYGIKMNIHGKSAKKSDITDGWTETRQYSKLPEIQKFIADYIATDPSEPMYLQDYEEFWGNIGKGCDLDGIDINFPDTNPEEYDQHIKELDLSPVDAL
ncbi:hypothetical protein J8002_001917 [Salmonella enterica]|nr:hypothetical protein [Salmonella enterica]